MAQKSARNEAVAAVQAKAKALKEQQRSRLDNRHYYLFEIVGDRLQLDPNAIEEFILEGDQVWLQPLSGLGCHNYFHLQLNLFDQLFEANGRQALLFYYQEADVPVSGMLEVWPHHCYIMFVCICR